MKFTKYLKDQINYILVFITYCIIIIGYLNIMEVDPNIKIVLITISTIIFIAGIIITYIKKNRYIKNISSIIEHLDEKYLISEVMEKPKRQGNIAYYKILKKATKSMLEKVSKVIETQREYKEYIESWVHEIKIPITSVKLLCENNKSEVTLKIDEEMEEINNYVEQALFYARLDQVSNDFMIKEIKLADTIKTVINCVWNAYISIWNLFYSNICAIL